MAPGSVKLLFDEMFSKRQVEFVHHESKLGELQHVRRMGLAGMKDVEWIPIAVSKGYVLITGDRNEKTRGYTVRDLSDMGARVLLLGEFWDRMKGWQRAKWLVANIERISTHSVTLRPGTIDLIDRNVKVKTLACK